MAAAPLGGFQIDCGSALTCPVRCSPPDAAGEGFSSLSAAVKLGHHFCAIERGSSWHGLPCLPCPQGQLTISSTGRLVDLGTARGCSLWLYPSAGDILSVGLARLPCGVAGGSGRTHIPEVDAIHKALYYLILQLQHDALGQLGPTPDAALKALWSPAEIARGATRSVAPHDAGGMARPILGLHTGNGGSAAQSSSHVRGVPYRLMSFFGHAHHGVKGGFPAHPGRAPATLVGHQNIVVAQSPPQLTTTCSGFLMIFPDRL